MLKNVTRLWDLFEMEHIDLYWDAGTITYAYKFRMSPSCSPIIMKHVRWLVASSLFMLMDTAEFLGLNYVCTSSFIVIKYPNVLNSSKRWKFLNYVITNNFPNIFSLWFFEDILYSVFTYMLNYCKRKYIRLLYLNVIK